MPLVCGTWQISWVSRRENIETKSSQKIAKKDQKSSKEYQVVQLDEDSEEESSEDEKPKGKKLYCFYHGYCGHTTDVVYSVLNDLVEQNKRKNAKYT